MMTKQWPNQDDKQDLSARITKDTNSPGQRSLSREDNRHGPDTIPEAMFKPLLCFKVPTLLDWNKKVIIPSVFEVQASHHWRRMGSERSEQWPGYVGLLLQLSVGLPVARWHFAKPSLLAFGRVWSTR